MIRYFAAAFLIGVCWMCSTGQDAEPTTWEKTAAQKVAADFYNEFSRTKDVGPLIDKYFVRDFNLRLKYTNTHDEDWGFARDFWEYNKTFIRSRATVTEYRRLYVFEINYYILYLGSARLFAANQGIDLDKLDDESTALDDVMLGKAFLAQLNGSLGPNHDNLMKCDLLGHQGRIEFTANLTQIRHTLGDCEQFALGLKRFEESLSSKATPKTSSSAYVFKPGDFRIGADTSTVRFFRYPAGTRILDAWSEAEGKGNVPFKMDMIKENNRLRIVAIYPPMD